MGIEVSNMRGVEPMLLIRYCCACSFVALALAACGGASQSFNGSPSQAGAGSTAAGTGGQSSAGGPSGTGAGAGAPSSADAASAGAPAMGPDTMENAKCSYTDDASFCACMAWSCGGLTLKDKDGQVRTVYCGGCDASQICVQNPVGTGVGTCGGSNPIKYKWPVQKIDMLVAIGENDNTDLNYDYAENIMDGRGYTTGKVGFCSGTGDLIVVLQCYNDLKPGNVLAKYMGHRDAAGKAVDGMIYYNDLFFSTGENQGDTKLIDSLGNFIADVAAAGADPAFQKCEDDVASAYYMAAAVQRGATRGVTQALTLGFMYDTELNFGDGDESAAIGAKSVFDLADQAYGPSMPASFEGKPWEESKWLGYVIKERALVMDKDEEWQSALDQNATWEAARRQHTATSNMPESATDLSMDYAIESKYKASDPSAGTPCWPTILTSKQYGDASIYTVTTNKPANATDQSKWSAMSDGGDNNDGYAACPVNPTP